MQLKVNIPDKFTAIINQIAPGFVHLRLSLTITYFHDQRIQGQFLIHFHCYHLFTAASVKNDTRTSLGSTSSSVLSNKTREGRQFGYGFGGSNAIASAQSSGFGLGGFGGGHASASSFSSGGGFGGFGGGFSSAQASAHAGSGFYG
jgi:hypothetical protein